MKKVLWSGALALAFAALVALAPPRAGPGRSSRARRSIGVRQGFLPRGERDSTQKRNTVILKGADGKQMVFGLLDTTRLQRGDPAEVLRVAILERKASVGGGPVATGAFGSAS